MGFKFNEHKSRPVYADTAETVLMLTDSERDELLKMMNDVNRQGCVLEPLYKEEHINRATLVWKGGAWQDFIGILLSNGYEVTAKCNDGIDLKVTWKDKNDLAEEIKREARKIGEQIEMEKRKE